MKLFKLYTATDSIFTAFKRGDVLDISMGGVTFKSSEAATIIKRSAFILPKTYGLVFEDGREKIVIKGVTNPKISFDELEKARVDFQQEHLQHKKDFYFKEANLIKLINLDTYTKIPFSPDRRTTTALTINNRRKI